MRDGQSLARAIRLTQIQHALHQNANGLTTRELAGICGVCIRTIQRDLWALQADLRVPLTQEGDRYGIVEGYVLPPISFSLYEAMALFLMSRLILRQTDESNPHIQTALTKLSSVLPGELSERLKKSSRGLDRKAANPHYVHIYEQVAVAWATRRRMRILYQSLRDAEGKEWLLDPYLVEMTGVGYSAYVIGMAKGEEREGLTTFKLDRIREAELLGHSFTVPDGLDLEGLLSTGWGVWWGEETEVKLKFSPNVARRVKESIWHPTQVVEDLQDGSCILTVRVGNTLEMTPWIRSWGPDVEVLAPQALRDDFCGWAERLHVMYETKRHKK